MTNWPRYTGNRKKKTLKELAREAVGVKQGVIRQLELELARRDFYRFCTLLDAEFYQEDRVYLKTLCQALQGFYQSEDYALIVNMPPRHGKSRTAQHFTQWLLGVAPQIKIITGSYNEILSGAFSKNVRDTISMLPGDGSRVVYHDIFPKSQIKKGDAAAGLWSLVGSHANYLATSPSGTATGFGCDMLIIDDIIKNAEEAYNRNHLAKLWDWFANTMLSRLEEGGKILIVMTRWAMGDLAGRAMLHFQETGRPFRQLLLPAQNEKGEMLCPAILSAKSYAMRCADMGRDIAAANYQQQPIDIQGRLYSSFPLYREPPGDWQGVFCYTDTADCGKDYLCAIIYGLYQGEGYLLDVLYSQESMEKTEPALAALLARWHVNVAKIESNNGGRGFARNLARLLQEKTPTCGTVVRWFQQTGNKEARILSQATWVMQHLYFPEGWQLLWPDFSRDLLDYQRQGNNLHDDAPDALTGVAETIQEEGNLVTAPFDRYTLGL